MAYRRRSARRTSRRRSYAPRRAPSTRRRRVYSSYRGRATGGRRRSAGGARTLRIVLEQAAPAVAGVSPGVPGMPGLARVPTRRASF